MAGTVCSGTAYSDAACPGIVYPWRRISRRDVFRHCMPLYRMPRHDAAALFMRGGIISNGTKWRTLFL